MPLIFSAAQYTRHNTLVAMLVFLAIFLLVALVLRLVQLRRNRKLPYGIRPITVYENKLDQWPVPGSYEDIVARMAEIEYDNNPCTDMVQMVDAWKLMEPSFR